MTESKFGFCHWSTGCRLNDRIQVWILSWSTGRRLNDVKFDSVMSQQGVDSMTSSLTSLSQQGVDSMTESKFGFCHGQQGVDSMTSSLDSVMVNRV